jgi:hypothetical protein
MEAGAPSDGVGSQPGEVAAVPTIHTAGGCPTGCPNPEPSPWHDPLKNATPGPQESPEPAPWHLPNGTLQNGGSNPNTGNGSGNNTGSTVNHPPRIGHWDLKDVAASE